MKRIIIALFFLVGIFGSANVNAQQKKPAKTSTVKAKDSTTAKTGMKKNGTPDMRYKANKEAKTDTTVHRKKDGTADKRYKENKDKK